MRIRYASGVFLLAPVVFAQTTNTAASISGHIVSPAGHAVRAVVTLEPTGPRGVPTRSRRTMTAADGSFTFQHITAGKYQICAQIPETEAPRSALPFLDTCSWGSANSAVTVAAGQQLTGVKFTAPNGTWLQIRVNDPGQLLPQAVAVKGPPTLEPALQLLVRGPDKLPHHAQFVSKDVGGRNYRMMVPLNTALSLKIMSSVAKAFDSAGNLVQAEIGLQPAAVSVAPMTFTVHN